jgi:hypothetical protein
MKCIYALAFMLILVTQCCQIKHVSAMRSHLAKLFGCQNNFVTLSQIVDVFRAKYTLRVCVCVCVRACTAALMGVESLFPILR